MKRTLLVAIVFAQPGDAWFSRDKLKHFLVSAFAQSVSYATLQAAYRHPGFFFAMDTYREYQYLNDLWARGEAPWAVWRGRRSEDPGDG